MNRILAWLRGPPPINVGQVPWLVKDFNVLYRVADRAARALRGDADPVAALADLTAQLERLAPAFTDTEEVRKSMRQG
jgi:hypothetical protein